MSENKNIPVETVIDNALRSSLFQVIISDNDGEVSIEIIDHYTLTKTTISTKTMEVAGVLSAIGMAKMVIKNMKLVCREHAK